MSQNEKSAPLLRRGTCCAVFNALCMLHGSLAADPAERVNLLLKWRHQFQFAGYYAAQAKGYYAAEGIEVVILEGGAELSPISSVLAGKAEFGVSDAELVLARLRGQPVVACASIFQHSPYVIMSRRDRQIRTPADLIGKRIMLSDEQGAAQLRTMMIREGIDPAVSIVKHSWRLRDLIEGNVDAMSGYAMVEPAHMRALGVEPSIMRAIDYGVDFYGDTLFTTEKQWKDHPARTHSFIHASLKGWQYAMRHPDEVVDLILKMDGVEARGLTRQMLLDEAAGMKPYILADIVDIGHMNPGRWLQIAHSYQAAEGKNVSGSLDGFIYNPDRVKFEVIAWISAVVLALLLTAGLSVLFRLRSRRRALREVQMLLDTMLDNSPSLIFIKDVEGKYLLINRRFEEFFSISRAEVIGKRDEEIFEKEQALQFRENDRRVLREGPGTFEETAVSRGSLTVHIVSKFPVRDSSGGIRGTAGIATDITEHRAAQEKIAEQASLLDKARDAILVRDLNHRITYWNKSAERLYGWSADEAVGRMVSELLYKDLGDFNRASAQVVRTGEWIGELQQISRSGQVLTVEGRWTLVQSATGEASILAINTDITERRKLEQQFLRAQRLESIGTLAGGIAHDLNNVLTPILMAAELLQGSVTGRDRGLLDRIVQSAQRAADMVNQVLAFARGVEGRRGSLQVESVIEDVETIIRDTFPRAIEIAVKVEPDLHPVYGEPTQLHQVLLNLCVNARDAITGSGRIVISARNVVLTDTSHGSGLGARTGAFVCIEVEDTGTGIPSSIIEKIFDPFFTTKATGTGTGLGLSTSLTIVKSHGGFMHAVSQPGQTQIALYLPASEEAEKMEHTSDTQWPEGQGETLLLVDDEQAIREVLGRTLTSTGYRVLFAANGKEALEVYRAHQADIRAAIIDVMMPVMDGPETIRALLRINPQFKIIASSGIPASRDSALDAGASSFIAKPYSTEALLVAVKELLRE